MKHPKVLLAALSISCFPALAQTQPSPPAETATPAARSFVFQRYKWDVSVDATFLLPRINQPVIYSPSTYASPLNNYSPYDLGRSATFMLRKNEVTRNAANVPLRRGAYRLNVNWAADFGLIKQDSIQVYNPGAYGIVVEKEVHYAGIGVSAGYEWQQQFGRFQLFYGADIFAGHFTDKRAGQLFYIEADPSGNPVRREKPVEAVYRRSSIGFAPLAGVKYFIHPHLSLSMESSVYVRYSWNYQKSDYSSYFLQRTAKGNGLATSLIPISALNLTFHFGSTDL